MPKQPAVAEYLTAIQRALSVLNVRWYVFGAQAVIFAGAVRTTADIDITVEDVPVEQLVKALKKVGFVLRTGIKDLDDLIEHHRILPMEHLASGMQLDVVRAGPGPEQQMLARVTMRKLGRTQIPFIDTNDLLVLKTLARDSTNLVR